MTFRPPNVPGNPMLPHGMPQPMYAPMPPFAMGMRPGVPGQPMPPSGPGLIPMVPPGVRLPMPPPMGMVPPPGQQPIISAPPMNKDAKPTEHVHVHVRVPLSAADMKVATTVFVGNISDKASDTLVRQILLRCGAIEGWKRVQDASGKLQAFGFCEYANPDSTLRALRLLHNLKLGEKALVVKVDANTRKDLLKYLTRTKKTKNNESFDDESIDKVVAEIEEKNEGTTALLEVADSEMQKADDTIKEAIDSLLRDHVAVLSSSKTSEDVKREHDVKESILFMAKQSGKIDPDSTLDDVDMEDDMKTLVSDEIKRFRQAYQKDEEQYGKRSRDSRRDREQRDRERGERGDRDRDRDRDKTREQNGEQKEPDKRRDRSRSPRTRSPRRSPVRSRSQERQEREKRRESQRQREMAELAKEEEEYEDRQRQRKLREREKAYRECLGSWESRERRKHKEHDKDFKREEERREEMEQERKHLAKFLEEYDDEKDDQKYYRGSAYARRRREREMEIEDDERDRLREKDEIETLRLQVMERQARKKLADGSNSSSGEESPGRMEDEDDVDLPVKMEMEENIPLTKPGYSVPSAYPPIQVQSAPAVQAPEIKDHPKEKSIGDGITIEPVSRDREEALKREESGSPGSRDSPVTSSKLTFGYKKSTSSTTSSGPTSSSSLAPSAKKSKLQSIFSGVEDEAEEKPKKILVPIEYSDEESEQVSERKRKGSIVGGVGSSFRGGSELDGDKKLTAEDRKRLTQDLVNSIPTSKEEVFQYQLKWEQIDKALIDKRVGPWINKKINEYIGEEEPVLTEFICNKLACHISPEAVLSDIKMVLDDEAEVFVVKLWRLLIYETEAKHLGIAKSY